MLESNGQVQCESNKLSYLKQALERSTNKFNEELNYAEQASITYDQLVIKLHNRAD